MGHKCCGTDLSATGQFLEGQKNRSKCCGADAAWEMAVPPPIELDGSVVGGLRPSAVGVNIEFKLKNMIIPVVDFDDTTVEEAIDFLRQRATELDKWELDPVKKGINFVRTSLPLRLPFH